MTHQVPLRARKKERTRALIASAALKLFAARGFQAVTLAEIADAAEVGQRTLFRYFPDKEELLFGDDAAVQNHLGAALAERPAKEPPAAAVREAVVSLAQLWQNDRERGRTRRAVIDASSTLKARERAKHGAYERVLSNELSTRGLDQHQARLLARTAVVCADEAIARWFSDDDPTTPGLESRIREAFAELAQLLHSEGPPTPGPSSQAT